MRELLFPYGLPGTKAGAPGWELVDSAGLRVAAPTLQNAVRGARVMTDAAILNDETFTIHRGDASSQVYTAKTTLTPAAGEFLLGASNTTALTNLGFAITGGGTTTEVAAGTEPCLEYDVASNGTTITLTAVNYGSYLNTAIGNFAASNGSWAAATTGVVTPDFKTSVDYDGTQISGLAAPVAVNGVWPIVPTAAQTTGQVTHCEFDDDSATDFIRDDFLLATTDHPKAKYTRGCIYSGRIATPASDIVTGGLLIDIPINASHAKSGDHTGDDTTMPPATDDVINGDWIQVLNKYTGFSEIAPIKDFDADGGAGANEARITLPTDSPLQNVSTFQGAGADSLIYRIYRSAVTVSGDLGTQAKADVTTEIEAALTTTARAEPSGVPAANASLADRIVWGATLDRNKITNDGSTQTLFADDGSTPVATAAVSESGGTVTRAEWT